MRERQTPLSLAELRRYGPGDEVDQVSRMLELAEEVRQATEGVLTKALVATAESQGDRPGDFLECVPGELVHLNEICANGSRNPDSECGCAREFCGLNSHEGTTTATVSLVPLSLDDYIEAYRSSLAARGMPADQLECEALEMLDLVSDWRPGTIVERRGWQLSVRRVPPIGHVP